MLYSPSNTHPILNAQTTNSSHHISDVQTPMQSICLKVAKKCIGKFNKSGYYKGVHY